MDDPDINVTDPPATLIDAEGNFTEDFTKALPGYLGKETLTREDGSPIKMFEHTPNLGSLVKMAYGAKTDLGKKLDNVIQKPGERASEEDIAKYMAEIDTARGVPAEAQNYEFPLAEGETEETLYSEDEKTAYKEFAKKHNVPSSVFNEFVLLNKKFASGKAAAITQKIQEGENEAIEKLKTDNSGDKLNLAGKQVFNALSKFNKNNPEFLAKMKESGVFENPTDFQRWKNAGVTPQNFGAWLSIAQELKISHSSDSSPGAGSGATFKDMLPESAKRLGDK